MKWSALYILAGYVVVIAITGWWAVPVAVLHVASLALCGPHKPKR